jgi:hypothetical protein
MSYFTDRSSTPEFKACEGKQEKLGGFDKIMWNMLKKEAKKKCQDSSIKIIDTECMDRDSLKRSATEKYVDDQVLSTFSATRREIAGTVAIHPRYQYIATPHISSPSCSKKMRNPTTPILPDGAER